MRKYLPLQKWNYRQQIGIGMNYEGYGKQAVF